MQFIQQDILHGIIPRSIQTNFDWRLKTAISNTWRFAPVNSSFHHFVLTLLNHAMNDIDLLDLTSWQIMKKIILLSWLPADRIRDAFEWICQSINDDLRGQFENFIARLGTSNMVVFQ